MASKAHLNNLVRALDAVPAGEARAELLQAAFNAPPLQDGGATVAALARHLAVRVAEVLGQEEAARLGLVLLETGRRMHATEAATAPSDVRGHNGTKN